MQKNQKEAAPVSCLAEALGLKKRELISLVGAGGKTTLMYRLAKELFLAGKRVVTTTTTKILEPNPEETNFLFIDSDEMRIKDFVWHHVHQYGYLTVAREKLGAAKLKGISADLVDDLWRLNEIDFILVEADGSAGRPIKAPRPWEPVIPAETTLVIGIMGIDGLGKKVDEKNVFYPEGISKVTGLAEGEELSSEGMALLITHSEGIFKGAPSSSRVIAFLNKVDIQNGVTKAKRISEKIFEEKHLQIERVVLGQLRDVPPVAEVLFP